MFPRCRACQRLLRVVGALPAAPQRSDANAVVNAQAELPVSEAPPADTLEAWSAVVGVDVSLCDGCLTEALAAEEQLRRQPCCGARRHMCTALVLCVLLCSGVRNAVRCLTAWLCTSPGVNCFSDPLPPWLRKKPRTLRSWKRFLSSLCRLRFCRRANPRLCSTVLGGEERGGPR